MRHVLGGTFACVECITDENLPEDDSEDNRNTTILTVWNGYMVCIYHLPKVVEQHQQSLRMWKRPAGDIIDGQCQEREYGPNGVRRCLFAKGHSDPHNWGKWE